MKHINGIYWPDSDKKCHPVVPGQVKDLEKALKYVSNTDLVVQAGGNVGIWPLYLADRFDKVLTFEPDMQNFECLLHNIKDSSRICPYNVALGAKMGFCGLERDPKNVGAHHVKEEGNIEVWTIDHMDLPACDLIVLDIEGTEPQALLGAERTIKKFKPVLMVEDKGLSERYGVARGWSDNVEGYKVAERVHRDVVLVPG